MNFKKLLCIGLAVVSIFSSAIAVGAQEAETAVLANENAELMATEVVKNGVFTYEIDTKNNEAVVIGMDGYSNRYWTPAATVTISGVTYNLVGIDNGAGSGLETLEKVELKNAKNLRYIGENCFSYCPKLATVNFISSDSSLSSIGNNSFYYCDKLETVTNLEYQPLTEVGSSVFGLTPFMNKQNGNKFVWINKVLVKYNGTDTAVTLPEGTVAIADAFFGKDIESVDFSKCQSTIKTIGNNAFYGCRKLKSIKIPASCTKVGDMAFAGCTSLETVEYAGKLASIGFCSFANCSELTSFKYTGSGSSTLTNIGECAFWNDRKLNELDAGTIVNVNVGSFWNCFGDGPDATDYYRIPNTVKTIAEGGYGNLLFTYVTVPESVQAFASTAFGSTSGATYVVKKGSAADTYFQNSGYSHIFYGDMNADGNIDAKDLKTVADYIAKGINDLNHGSGTGVIADGDNDGNITMKDLNDIFKSIKAEVEAGQSN